MAAILAMGAVGAVGSADETPVNNSNWKAYYTKQTITAGVYPGKKAMCYMVYSTYGQKINVTRLYSTKADVSTDVLNIRCTDNNVTMTPLRIKYRGTYERKPSPSGRVPSIHFEFYAETEVLGNTFTSEGLIESKDEK